MSDSLEQHRREVRYRADVLGVFLRAVRLLPAGRVPDEAWFDVTFAAFRLRRSTVKLLCAGTPRGPRRTDLRRPW